MPVSVIVGVLVMMMPVIMRVIVRVIVAMGAAVAIGAAFGVERRGKRNDLAAELQNHVLDHVIAANAQAFTHQLCRQVPVAEMPGNFNQMGRVLGEDLDKILRLGQHFDKPAVFQLQPVAMVQMDGRGFVQEEGQAARPGENRPAAVTIVKVKGDPVGRGCRPCACGVDLVNADHAASITLAIIA